MTRCHLFWAALKVTGDALRIPQEIMHDRRCPSTRLPALGLAAWLVAVLPGVSSEPLDFGRDVQPILSNRCYACHGPDEQSREAGLRLDQREAAVATRDDGAAIVPGDPDASLLVQRILTADPDDLMPPPKAKKPLTQAEKDILTRWVQEGAEYARHWSFEPIRKPTPPTVSGDDWSRGPVDRFVLEHLTANDTSPAAETDRATFLRRVTLDLTGLPPTVQELDAFLADKSPDAYEVLVDRLLASDDHAERMTAVWLDHARYADSNGYQFDNERTMWPWRDWVINAFRQNMPWDRFITEQLAGDLLENPTQAQLIATGFNRNHGYSIEGGIIDEEYRVLYANDKTTTVGTLFLGLTMDCTRCHDHKYDPVTMADYYSLFAFFNHEAEAGAPGEAGRKKKAAPPYIELQPSTDRPAALAMIMKDAPRETHILKAGQFDQPGALVTPRTPEVLPPFDGYPANRLGLAQWLTSSDNPLFARVTVNRVWQQLFGTGLVKTADNFGLQGEPPSHPELLDWLASDFRESGWNLRHLVKQIVLSATYRQHSRFRPEIDDPENRLLARGPSFRLPAETIRDQALAVSGLLTPQVGGPSVRPYQAPGIWEDLNAPKSHAEVYKTDTGPALYRKSMYTYWRRGAMHPGMAVFDAPSRDVCTVERPVTNTPLQALAVLHGPTYIEAARQLATRLLRNDTASSMNDRITLALRSTLARTPAPEELVLLAGLHRDRLVRYQNNAAAADKLLGVGASPLDPDLDRAELAALTDVCLAIFNLSETVTRK